eukprot:6202461-Pleurochrysis_carterae.AAC.3
MPRYCARLDEGDTGTCFSTHLAKEGNLLCVSVRSCACVRLRECFSVNLMHLCARSFFCTHRCDVRVRAWWRGGAVACTRAQCMHPSAMVA